MINSDSIVLTWKPCLLWKTLLLIMLTLTKEMPQFRSIWSVETPSLQEISVIHVTRGVLLLNINFRSTKFLSIKNTPTYLKL